MYPRLGRIWVPCPSPEEGLLVVVNGTLKKGPTESLNKRCFYLINQEQLSAQMFNVGLKTSHTPVQAHRPREHIRIVCATRELREKIESSP